MTIYRKLKRVVHDYPAYDVVEYEKDHRGHIHLKAGDTLVHDDVTQHHNIGSVCSSAIEEGDCPHEATERAKGFGHDLHYVYPIGSVISNMKTEKGRRIWINSEDTYCFEGVIFKFEPLRRDHLKMVKVGMKWGDSAI